MGQSAVQGFDGVTLRRAAARACTPLARGPLLGSSASGVKPPSTSLALHPRRLLERDS